MNKDEMIGFNVKLRESIKKYKGKKHPVDLIGYKLKGYALADKLGIKHAKVIGIFNRIEDVIWETLPNEFVIHPQYGCGTRGVLPLIYCDGKYKNILGLWMHYIENLYMTKEEIIAYFKNGIGLTRHQHSENLWIEELLGNPVPCNWEFHSFNGKIGLVEQIYKASTPRRRKFWTTDWKSLGHIFQEPEEEIKKIIIDIKAPAPKNKDRLLEVASMLSKAVKHPYVRVDLYDIGDKVYIGELTPHPGTFALYHFIDYWNKILGELWEEAEKELNSKGVWL